MPKISSVFRSLSVRLFLMFVLTGFGISASIIFTFSFFWDKSFVQIIVPRIANHVSFIADKIGNPPNLLYASEAAKNLHLDFYLISPDTTWSSNGKLLSVSDIQFRSKLKGNTLPLNVSFGFYQHEKLIKWSTNKFDLYLIENGATSSPTTFKKALAISTALVIFILCICYGFTRYLFSPIKIIGKGVNRFGQGNLSQPIKVNRADELGNLADQINIMADKIQDMLESKRQLLLSISHELRTPITRAHLSVVMLEDSSYKDEIQDDLKDMERLIADLLEGERLNSDHKALNKSTQSINKLFADIRRNYIDQPVKFTLLDTDILVELDKIRLHLVLKNIINNAIFHSKETNREVEVTACHRNMLLTIIVTDFGVGIAEEHLNKLADPFYRVDSSRQRQSGGYGLGLYLSRLIVEAHDGKLTIASTLGKGTTVSIHLRADGS